MGGTQPINISFSLPCSLFKNQFKKPYPQVKIKKIKRATKVSGPWKSCALNAGLSSPLSCQGGCASAALEGVQESPRELRSPSLALTSQGPSTIWLRGLRPRSGPISAGEQVQHHRSLQGRLTGSLQDPAGLPHSPTVSVCRCAHSPMLPSIKGQTGHLPTPRLNL